MKAITNLETSFLRGLNIKYIIHVYSFKNMRSNNGMVIVNRYLTNYNLIGTSLKFKVQLSPCKMDRFALDSLQ